MASKCYECANKNIYDPLIGDFACGEAYCRNFSHFVPRSPSAVGRPRTNLDRIRAMDINHLIEWYCRGRPCGTCPYNGIECGFREWLEQEAQE